jgi:D-aminoacyl-tRNA deacylase
MIAVIQRVKKADVTIDTKLHSHIGRGLLVLLGIEKDDSEDKAKFLADKTVDLRIFEDENEKMNLSVKDVNGSVLVVSQFTLAGDCSKGKRPSFDKAEKPDKAIPLYEKYIEYLKEQNIPVFTGIFGAMMDIGLINDGPVTFIVSK